MSLKRGVFIVGCKRTPFGTLGGKLRDVNASELGQIASKAAIAQSNVPVDKIDNVVVGNIISISEMNSRYLARIIGLGAGVPVATPALCVNRLCGSGFQAVVNVAKEIALKDSEIGLATGAENMSQTPFVLREARFGIKFGKTPVLEDGLMTNLIDNRINMPAAITAENLVPMYNISREECDKFALLSQQRWATAHQAGKFKDEIVPITVNIKGKDVVVDTDEHPRPNTTLDILSKLSPVFKKDGVVTAGNASGISDGAAALVLASEDAVKRHSLTAMARVVGYWVSGVDASIMGIGPVPSIRTLCEKNSISLDQVDFVDVNEAFAAQFLAVQKDLGLDMNKTNVNGGAIALGHPLGASGTRILANLVYELKRTNKKYAIGSACIGGGQGISVLIENVS